MPSQPSPAAEQSDQLAPSSADKSIQRSNPFATKYIRAGAIQYRFPDGESLQNLQTRLANLNWRGQFVGPHGSGKSTLLATLDAHWRDWGRTPISVCLRNKQRTLPNHIWDDIRDQVADTVIIDGFEQLGFLCKCRTLLTCFVRKVGLIVTVHRPPSSWESRLLPTVFSTHASIELTRELASELLEAKAATTTAAKQRVLDNVPRQFARHGGNVRETFLSLYDDVAQ